jgi:23S rRNA pseudouridine2605 synthase
MRLARLMAERGVASRREAELWIAAGRVRVGGEIARGVVLVDPEHDDIRIDGRPLAPAPPRRWFLWYKPRGTVVTRRDPEGRNDLDGVLDELGVRVEPVGRLDTDTEGALLLTNDGGTAHRLLHPSRQVPKRYLVKCYRTPSDKDLEALRTGVWLEDGRTAPTRCRLVRSTSTGNTWVEITVTEGRNRLVRRMFAQLGHPVSKLRRESFATISIRGLDRGEMRPLTGEEVRRLEEIADGVSARKAGHRRPEGHARTRRLRQDKASPEP